MVLTRSGTRTDSTSARSRRRVIRHGDTAKTVRVAADKVAAVEFDPLKHIALHCLALFSKGLTQLQKQHFGTMAAKPFVLAYALCPCCREHYTKFGEEDGVEIGQENGQVAPIAHIEDKAPRLKDVVCVVPACQEKFTSPVVVADMFADKSVETYTDAGYDGVFRWYEAEYEVVMRRKPAAAT